MIDKKELYFKARQILTGNLDTGGKTVEIEPNGRLIDYGINSIAFIKTVIAIENEFDIEIEVDDLDYKSFPTLESFCEFVEGKLYTV